MAIISDEDAAQIRQLLGERLKRDVTLVHFTQKESKLVVPGVVPCAGCRDALQLLEELVALDDRLTLEVHDFVGEADLARELGVDHIPATIVRGADEAAHRVRLFGVPVGYEFSTLLEDIFDAGGGETELTPAMEALQDLDQDVHIQVFVTPTCPYCPTAVLSAHRFARANERITADMVMSTEFPDLAQRFAVMAVPKTVINGSHAFEGAAPDDDVARAVLAAVGVEAPELPQD